MRSFGALVLAFLVSGFVAGAVQNGMAAGWFNAGYEYLFAMGVLFAFTLVTTIALGAALAGSFSVDRFALWLLGLMLALVAALGVFGGVATRSRDLPLLFYIAVPCALMLAIQWWLVRRRARKV